MQFSSYIFILAFLPVYIVGYFALGKLKGRAADIFTLVMSCLFYACAGLPLLLMLAVIVAANYAVVRLLLKNPKKLYLAIGVLLNVGLLLYFKYFNFFGENISLLLGRGFIAKEILLPLGISFFAFQEIEYLAKTYEGETRDFGALDYALFILYFPKLTMGPLADPVKLIPQFKDKSRKTLDADALARGLKIFVLGLFKKVIIADNFAAVALWVFDYFYIASSADVLVGMLAYTFQIYFDFSGYSDMAVGIATMTNVTLPMNFNSPYKACSLRDFWKRWHITLTSFFTRYIYIPLGGSRRSLARVCVNILIVFLISGLWHGASWTFILWGLLHGLGLVFERLAGKWLDKIPPFIRWLPTFACVSLLWLLFRSPDVETWLAMLGRLFSFGNMQVSGELLDCFVLSEFSLLFSLPPFSRLSISAGTVSALIFFIGALAICLCTENLYKRKFSQSPLSAVIYAPLLVRSVMSLGTAAVFVYTNF